MGLASSCVFYLTRTLSRHPSQPPFRAKSHSLALNSALRSLALIRFTLFSKRSICSDGKQALQHSVLELPDIVGHALAHPPLSLANMVCPMALYFTSFQWIPQLVLPVLWWTSWT